VNGWSIRLATKEDAEFVYDHRWDRGEPELARYGVDRQKWIDACLKMVSEGNCFTIDRMGMPEAVLGLEGDSGVYHTWFQATSTESLPGLTRYLRRAINSLAKIVKAKKAIITALCAHPDAPGWYGFLGFKEDASFTCYASGPQPRRFVRTWDV